MNEMTPLVSAVIPTRNRPALVCRAVLSVLAQTMANVECIVVVDGPDDATCAALSKISDARLKVVPLRHNVGGCEARNRGARAARGTWVALLDDDDEWLPRRLETQLAAASTSLDSVTMVVSRFLDRGAEGDDLVRPYTFPKQGQPISDFLWCEVSWLGGIVGFPQTSTWLIRREFLLAIPFTPELKVLQDLDWLLRAYPHPRMRVVCVDEPLTIFHNESTRQRVTKRIDWQYCRQWAMANRLLFTQKAFGFFLVIYCLNPAAQQGVSWAEVKILLGQVWRYGKPSPKLLWLSFLYACIYPWIGKILSARSRGKLLYKLRTSFRRTPGSVKNAVSVTNWGTPYLADARCGK
jgi:glycosyltransferase involved in cell wall biosynthesis